MILPRLYFGEDGASLGILKRGQAGGRARHDFSWRASDAVRVFHHSQ